MKIYCVECKKDVEARLTKGQQIYPHLQHLHNLPFWICTTCKNYVGCHHKSDKPTKPLGNIPNKELRSMRMTIHAVLDPIWKSGKATRKEIYKILSEEIGYTYHTAEIKSVEEATRVLQKLKTL